MNHTAASDQTLRMIDLRVDVTADVDIGRPATTCATIYLPAAEDLGERPVVCFAFPGGGYNRRYYALDLPGDPRGQADYHTRRGWIFVACDSLGFGDSTAPDADGHTLTYEEVAAGNAATVRVVLERLAAGTLVPGYPPIVEPVRIGVGQSMGACFLIVAQAHHRAFDAIAPLGFSAIHTHVPARPGTRAPVWPWVMRGSDPADYVALNHEALVEAVGNTLSPASAGKDDRDVEHPYTWAWHWDGEPGETTALDIAALSAAPGDELPYWRSSSSPACSLYMVAPGTVATEAAAIRVPVLVGAGERDLIENLSLEPIAYRSSRDITLLRFPKMGHMHNFAPTRRLLWTKIHAWGAGVRETALLEVRD